MTTAVPKTRDWENVFSAWAKGPSKSEQERAENAERQVYQAIQNCDELKHRDIKVFTQGSYRNRVNVRQDSDVDVGVLCFDTYFPDFSDDNVKSEVIKRQEPASYTYERFKTELHHALVTRFGASNVTRGDKAFQIDENSYRVNADVAAFFEHRRYVSNARYVSGVQLVTDNERKEIVNWPEQHYSNGMVKNTNTHRHYKKAVRILKTLCNEMSNNGIAAAHPIPSFLVECLVWNTPNSAFDASTYRSMIRAVLAELFYATLRTDSCSEWGEVSELKYLFRSTQPWTREQAHSFLSAAWDYIGYE
ncbi:MAG: nucleotidyltransferase [Pseudomonadales bacterium]